MKVLIAEDDAFLISAYKVKFTKEGFDLLLATNGEEALEMLKKDKPDIMLLDLIMPKMDGFAVLEAMHADPELSKIPVIVASNLGQPEDIQRGVALGAREFVIKSDMGLEDLVDKVRALGAKSTKADADTV